MPYHNAMAENFFATLKLELMESRIHATRAAARSAVFEHVKIFCN